MAAEGKAFLDAPISGGPPGAEAATLGIMCSGDRKTFDALEAALNDIAAKVVYNRRARWVCADDEARK